MQATMALGRVDDLNGWGTVVVAAFFCLLVSAFPEADSGLSGSAGSTAALEHQLAACSLVCLLMLRQLRALAGLTMVIGGLLAAQAAWPSRAHEG